MQLYNDVVLDLFRARPIVQAAFQNLETEVRQTVCRGCWGWGSIVRLNNPCRPNRDGGIAKAMSSATCMTFFRVWTVPNVDSFWCADIEVCSASFSRLSSNVPTSRNLVSFDHCCNETVSQVWARKPRAPSALQRADAHQVQPHWDSKGALMEAGPLPFCLCRDLGAKTLQAFLDQHGPIWKPISLLENSGTFCIVEVDGMPQPIGEDEACEPKLGQTFCGDFLLCSDFWTSTALDGIIPSP